MKTSDEVLQELLEICPGWELEYDSTLIDEKYNLPQFTTYVYYNAINEHYSICMDYNAYTNQYMATHHGVKYNDDRSECGGYADTAEYAYIQLQMVMRQRSKNILNMVNEMTDIRNKNGNS